MTTPIVYTGGTYGTYLEWCLRSLTTVAPLFSPFNKNGNSHKFNGKHLIDIEGWKKFKSSTESAPFVRFHPRSANGYTLSKNLDYICGTTDSVIHLYPDKEHVLLILNNIITKVWTDWWSAQTTKDLDIDKIYQSWSIDPGTPFTEIPRWVRREFLSFYLLPSWFDELEWFQPDRWSNPKACVITTKDLLFDFEKSLNKIQKHCNLNFVRPIADLLPYHQENLNSQDHLTQDQLCADIINSIITKTDFNWEPLPLGSEFWLQWRLRNLGYELRCHGLDIFPTNSLHLKELLYPV